MEEEKVANNRNVSKGVESNSSSSTRQIAEKAKVTTNIGMFDVF